MALTWNKYYEHYTTHYDLYAPYELKDIKLPKKHVPFERLHGLYDIGEWTIQGYEEELNWANTFLMFTIKTIPIPIKAHIHPDFEYADYVMGYLPLFTIKPLRDFLWAAMSLPKEEKTAVCAALLHYGCVQDEEGELKPFGIEWSSRGTDNFDDLYEQDIDYFNLDNAKKARFNRKGINKILVLDSFEALNYITI